MKTYFETLIEIKFIEIGFLLFSMETKLALVAFGKK
jgi:hypothetical protein